MISFGDISNIKFYSIALLCGGLVLSPIIYYVFGEYPLIGSYFLKNETLEILIILAASLIIGLLMLDVATWLEGGIDEKLNELVMNIIKELHIQWIPGKLDNMPVVSSTILRF